MGSNDMLMAILGLGIVGVGGYFFMTQMWPSMKAELGVGRGAAEEEDIDIIQPIVEDRFPDYVIEDRYPDIVVEDKVPDYYPAPYPYPYPMPYPVPSCSKGRYWDGHQCKRIDCPPGYDWDDGECKIDCPSGYRRKNNHCEPRDIPDCDRHEYWDGTRCRRVANDDEDCPPGFIWSDGRCKRREVRCRSGYHNVDGECKKLDSQTERRWNNGNSRDRWHQDRDIEERIRKAVTPRTEIEIAEEKPAEERVKEITEQALQNFTQVWYA